ncbi:unnamed protein product [Sphenostylis stenocarpa]|uniref:SHSP domain-containing protein n=1 Tax=Sphenostylis stenocarpa TaxID=92480 RepID=A0AA86SUC3_9FABA|nr:unnamed protein product [Sphenostylis stenocarpa]
MKHHKRESLKQTNSLCKHFFIFFAIWKSYEFEDDGVGVSLVPHAARHHGYIGGRCRDKTHNAPTRSYVRDAKAMAVTPAVVKEYPDSYVFEIDMPGLNCGDIKVQVEDDNMLVISGERKREVEKEGAKYLRMERRVGRFMRKFVLPENTHTDAISAVCQDGVLSVSVQKLPPPEPKKPRTIQVNVA